jgi:hypothetical protein
MFILSLLSKIAPKLIERCLAEGTVVSMRSVKPLVNAASVKLIAARFALQIGQRIVANVKN